MAEGIIVIGLAASIASLLDVGSKVVSRLRECHTSGGNAPGILQDIRSQLPLILEMVGKLRAQLDDNSLSPAAEESLISTVAGCQRQIADIDGLLAKWFPSP